MVNLAERNRAVAKPGPVVRAHHDPESGWWWADSDDIVGLATEAPTYEALVERVRAVAPEIIAASETESALIEIAFGTVAANAR